MYINRFIQKKKPMLLDLIIIFTGTAMIFAIGFLTTKKEKSC